MTAIQCSLSHAFTGKALNAGETDAAKANSFKPQTVELLDFVAHITEIGGAWTPAQFTNGHRKSDNFVSAQMLALDLDNGKWTQHQLKADTLLKQYAFMIHHTPTSTPEHPKHRIIFILDTPITDRERYERAQLALLDHFRYLQPDTQVRDAARFFYGAVDKSAYYDDSKRLPLETVKGWWIEYETRRKSDKPDTPYFETAFTAEVKRLEEAAEGQRNDTLNKVAFNLYGMAKGEWPGITRERVSITLTEAATKRGLAAGEIEATLQSAWTAATPRPLPDKEPIDWMKAEKSLARVVSELVLLVAAGSSEEAQKQAVKQQAAILQVTLDRMFEEEQRETIIPTSKEVITTSKGEYEQALLTGQIVNGLKSGIMAVDYETGGFDVGHFTFVGDTGSGKSTLMATFCPNLLQQAPGLVIPTEMTAKEWVRRIIGYLSGVPYSSLKRGCHYNRTAHERIPFTDEEKARVQSAWNTLWAHGDRLHWLNTSSPSPQLIKKRVAECKEYYDIKWVILDSLDNVHLGWNASVYERASAASRVCKDAARDYEVAVLSTVQGGRNTKDRSSKILGLHDAVGSHRIEEDAVFHASLYNPWKLVEMGELARSDVPPGLPEGCVRLRINKNRNGESGTGFTIAYRAGIGFYGYSKEERSNGRVNPIN